MASLIAILVVLLTITAQNRAKVYTLDPPDCYAQDPLVSVILPYSAASEQLEAALGSLLNQSLGCVEVLVVVDGAAALELPFVLPHHKHSLVVYEQQQRLGLNAARNLGLSHAQAPLVVVTDASTVWRYTALEVLHAAVVRDSSFGYAFNNVEQGIPTSNAIPMMAEICSAGGPLRPPKLIQRVALGERVSCTNAWLVGILNIAAWQTLPVFNQSLNAGDGLCDMFLQAEQQAVRGVPVLGHLATRHTPPSQSPSDHFREAEFVLHSDGQHHTIREFQPSFGANFGSDKPLQASDGMFRLAGRDNNPDWKDQPVSRQQNILLVIPWFRMGGADR